MNQNKKILMLVLLIISMGMLNGCVFVNWINQASIASYETNENKNAAVKYLQNKYHRDVEKITYDSSSDTFGVRTGTYFSVRFEGEDFEFSISTEPKMEDSYLRNKWDYQMTKKYNSRVSEEVLKVFKEKYPQNSVLAVPIDIEWNHEKEFFNNNFEIPNSLLKKSIQDIYAQGYINKTNIRQHHWIKEDDLEEEKQKLLLYMPVLAKRINSPDMSISANYHIFTDKINVDIEKLQDSQIFSVIGNWDEYRGYHMELKDIDAVAKGNNEHDWNNGELNTSTFHYASDSKISMELKQLSKSKKLNAVIKNNKNFLEELKFNKSDIEKAIQVQLSGKYQTGISYNVVNIVLTDELFGESKIAFVRVKANDKYNTEFLTIVDCNDYRYSPEICMDNYIERFIEKYMEEDFFELDKFDVSDYCVEGSYIDGQEKYNNAIKNFRSGNYENMVTAFNKYDINILLSKSKHKIDERLLMKFEDNREKLWKLWAQNRNSGGGSLPISVTFIDEGSYKMYGDYEHIKSNLLYFVDNRKLLQYGDRYDWEYLTQFAVSEDASVIDGYHTFIKRHPLEF